MLRVHAVTVGVIDCESARGAHASAAAVVTTPVTERSETGLGLGAQSLSWLQFERVMGHLEGVVNNLEMDFSHTERGREHEVGRTSVRLDPLDDEGAKGRHADKISPFYELSSI